MGHMKTTNIIVVKTSCLESLTTEGIFVMRLFIIKLKNIDKKNDTKNSIKNTLIDIF